MSDYIEVTVRVPADLEVTRGPTGTPWVRRPNEALSDDPWGESVVEQIAAAIEARKPKPPKFGVGDVVEYVEIPVAGIVTAVHVPKDGTEPAYFLNNLGYSVFESAFKLVRRAEK